MGILLTWNHRYPMTLEICAITPSLSRSEPTPSHDRQSRTIWSPSEDLANYRHKNQNYIQNL